ncbi:MAG TPA: hypothetical protein VKQ73_12360 [Stellaceae bacterium]|nr:hypothetical protein [Stellaceae bacterium]
MAAQRIERRPLIEPFNSARLAGGDGLDNRGDRRHIDVAQFGGRRDPHRIGKRDAPIFIEPRWRLGLTPIAAPPRHRPPNSLSVTNL